jgi:sortase A
VARLVIRGRAILVLADSGGEGLAFGPTHVAGSAPPGGLGMIVISAHRDTHFKNIGDLRLGETVTLEANDGHKRRYRVTRTEVLDRPRLSVPPPASGDALALVTCWPLDGIDPGTQKRFVLHAQAIKQ